MNTDITQQKNNESPVSIVNYFIDSARKTPDAIAIDVDGVEYTYLELLGRAKVLAAELARNSKKFCVLYIDNNIDRYIAVIASLLANKTYVPISTKRGSIERCLTIMSQIDADEACYIIASEQQEKVATMRENLASTALCLGKEHFACDEPQWQLPDKVVSRNGDAVMLFTSGSTGSPKGVLISHANIGAYLGNIMGWLQVKSDARFCHMASYAFDCHIHDIFVPWFAGARVCIFENHAHNNLFLSLREKGITHSLLAPCVVNEFKRGGFNVPGFLPDMQVSLFGGEPVYSDILTYWANIAPNSDYFNVYGPTEATVIFTYQQWTPEQSGKVVPIGQPFPGHEVRVVDDKGNQVSAHEVGELYLNGPQVSAGYYNHIEKVESFAYFEDSPQIWYRTGDYCKYDEQSRLTFEGRADDRLKVSGLRIERLELENEIRKATGVSALAVVPVGESNFCKTFAVFIAPGQTTKSEFLHKCQQALPARLCPGEVYIEALPISQNLKVEYPKLKQRLKNMMMEPVEVIA
ncbi:AMP-binding protein [Pseudoalteromonas sp. S16_S37]|uniref:AMP-binding protein n=1 Tax=Pseudoalteromonas sp. S16_S37 TaxID=2720228 RepID=UPI001681656B|nr:AMP-binding protein [Pseudoalteromonas sp. S16_S37]MBD1584446.1 D-alanine--poly(phosphoribitol) ligase [Pseudoalteromonas sp. S16_S37]